MNRADRADRRRILLVGPFPLDRDRPGGGVEAVTSNLLRGLGAIDGLEVEVVAPAPGPGPERSVELPDGRVTYVPVGPGFQGWRRDLHGRLLPLVRRRRADLVHVQGLASIAARVPGALFTEHGAAERDAFHTHRGPGRYARAGALLAIEGVPRRWARRRIVTSTRPVPRQRRGRQVWHIPNPIDPEFYRPAAGGSRDHGAFVYLGRITPLKDVAGVIQAFGPVAAETSTRLVIAGPGVDSDYGRHCRELAARLGLARAVTFQESLTVGSSAALLRSAGTLVLFSRQERAPMVVAEALAAGTQVVASAVGEVPALVQGLPGCQLVPAGDREGLAERLRRSLSGESGTADRCRRDRARWFHPSAVAARTQAVYTELITADTRDTATSALRGGG